MSTICTHEDCPSFEPGKDEDDCENCVDGRNIELVCEHASTCDGCAELTSHEEMVMDEDELGYCEKCAKEMGLLID